MALGLYASGLAHARALIAAGKVDESADWSFSADDGNALLGDPPNWPAYGRWFLGHDPAVSQDTKAAFAYPFGRAGKLYRSALRAIASRASANNEAAISTAASDLIKELDAKKSVGTVRRAYSTLEIKAVNEDQRILEGIASTPSTDRMGDVVEPDGAVFKLPIPLLWQHCADEPIGWVTSAKVTQTGIAIVAQLATVLDPGTLKDRLDEAWQSIKAKLVRGLSIGFMPIEESDITGTWGTRFTKWEWLELSAVTIPANADATIQTVKSYDIGRAAPGRSSIVVSANRPGASGARVSPTRTSLSMKTYADQIAAFEATRAAKSAQMDGILEKASAAGLTLDETQKQEYDGLDAEVKAVDEHLVRLRAAEARNAAQAKPVDGTTAVRGTESRGLASVSVSDVKLDKGIAFARFVGCKMAAFIEMHKGNFVSPLAIAKARYPSHSALHEIFQKTAVDAGTTSASHAYDDLVPYQVLASDFIDYLRPKTIIGKFGTAGANGVQIPSLRRVPFNIRVGGFTAGTTGYWKGEGKPIPLSNATSENVTLTWATAAGLTVLTQELMRFSTPSAEQMLRDDLAAAVIARCDIDFVDPSKAAVANTSPASITNAIAATAPSGTAAVNVRHDLNTLLQLFAQNLQSTSGLVLIMSDTMASALSMMVNTLGNRDFPDLSPDGGSIVNIPVITSEHLTSVGSPSTQTIVLMKPSEVYLADDGQVTVDASMEASVEMSDAPSQDGTAGTGASMVSLWQTGLIGLRAERVINWKLRRSTSVQYISPAAYAPPTS